MAQDKKPKKPAPKPQRPDVNKVFKRKTEGGKRGGSPSGGHKK